MIIADSSRTNSVNKFYYGVVDGSDFLLDGCVKDVSSRIDMYFNVHEWADTNVQYYTFGVLLDQKETGGSAGATSYDRSAKLNSDYSQLYSIPTFGTDTLTDTSGLTFKTCVFATYSTQNGNMTLSDVSSSGKTYYKAKIDWGNQTWQDFSRVTSTDEKISSISFNLDTLNIFNMVDDERIGVPVAYKKTVGGETQPVIYLTNQNISKDNQYTSRTKETFYYRRNNTAYPQGEISWIGLLDPGFVLEPEDKGSTTQSWDNRSMLKAKRLAYTATLPYTNTKMNNHMIDGLLIAEMPNDKNTIEWADIEIDITKTSPSSEVYACFSKNPMDTINYADSVTDTTASLLNIVDTSTAVKHKKVLLNNGTNTIRIEGLSKADLLYMKISVKERYGTDSTIINQKPSVTIKAS